MESPRDSRRTACRLRIHTFKSTASRPACPKEVNRIMQRVYNARFVHGTVAISIYSDTRVNLAFSIALLYLGDCVHGQRLWVALSQMLPYYGSTIW